MPLATPSAVHLPLRPPAGQFYDLPHSLRPRTSPGVMAIYIHIPFCTVKCHYCDFFSVAGHLDQAPALLAALAMELRLQIQHFGPISPKTIFIGGGTPTLLPPPLLQNLMTTLHQHIDFSAVDEFTIEANPNTFDADCAAILHAAGVNRISFGAQSFVPTELLVLQRDHNPDNVAQAVRLARAAGIDNINLDLIFAIPGQTQNTWDYSLNQALALEPQHLSCYALMYESNTPLTARLKSGHIQAAPEPLEISLAQHTQAKLAAAGFPRYEISNYARPGHECRHNLHYWHSSNHLAIGPSAWAHYQGIRWKNIPAINRYTTALLADTPRPPIIEMEHLSARQRAGELAVLLLRLRTGLHWMEFQHRTGINAAQILSQVLQKYDGLGYLEVGPQHLALTDQATMVSDTILADVLAAFG